LRKIRGESDEDGGAGDRVRGEPGVAVKGLGLAGAYGEAGRGEECISLFTVAGGGLSRRISVA